MIEELNTAMKEQFTKEFGNIQQMFTTVFQDLFEGGTASLELMDNENILECGIRIIAQPPGKKLQNIMLLSGGESVDSDCIIICHSELKAISILSS